MVERHHRIDNERRKQKQELKETKRIEDEVIAKKKAEKEKIKKVKRREEPKIRGHGKSSALKTRTGAGVEGEGEESVSEDSGSDSDSDSDSDYDRYSTHTCHAMLCSVDKPLKAHTYIAADIPALFADIRFFHYTIQY